MAKIKTEGKGKVDGLSADVWGEKLNALQKLVPEAFVEGKLDAEKFRHDS
jgi:hypothetical protein